MFVVNTTSATVGASPDAASSPEKRVPSSRRRNPGVLLEERFTARYGFFGAGFGVVGAGVVVLGFVVVGLAPPGGVGAAPVGAGFAGVRPGTAFAPPAG